MRLPGWISDATASARWLRRVPDRDAGRAREHEAAHELRMPQREPQARRGRPSEWPATTAGASSAPATRSA